VFDVCLSDCREGLPVAVEKARYESLEQGVKLAVNMYVKTLQEKQASKDLRVYVHPITPGPHSRRASAASRQPSPTSEEEREAVDGHDRLRLCCVFSWLRTMLRDGRDPPNGEAV
jgi:hypothetical protein